MSVTRVCDADGCGKLIERDTVIELGIRVLKVREDDDQDAVEEHHADYCDACILSGAAVKDLAGSLVKHLIPLALDTNDGDAAAR